MGVGLKRHRNHQILIAREVKSYIVNMKMSMSNYLSEENDDSKSQQSDKLISLDSLHEIELDNLFD